VVVPSVPGDTSADIQRLLDERWRAASPIEKAAQVDQMFCDCTAMALTGISLQYPDATPDEVRYHLAVRRYGRVLAEQWFKVTPNR